MFNLQQIGILGFLNHLVSLKYSWYEQSTRPRPWWEELRVMSILLRLLQTRDVKQTKLQLLLTTAVMPTLAPLVSQQVRLYSETISTGFPLVNIVHPIHSTILYLFCQTKVNCKDARIFHNSVMWYLPLLKFQCWKSSSSTVFKFKNQAAKLSEFKFEWN